MVKELFDSTIGKILPFAEYNEIEDSPGENTAIRIVLPFHNLETDENIIVTAYFDEKEKLFQLSDMGFCYSKIDEPDRKSLNENRNFIRANGFIFDYKKDNNHFFVLGPVVNYESEDVNMGALIAHFLTILMSYNR